MRSPIIAELLPGADLCGPAIVPAHGGTIGTPYSQAFPPDYGGTAPYTWSVIAGALPDGLELDPSTGELSGIPTTRGLSDFVVGIVDSPNPIALHSSTAEDDGTHSSLTVGIPAGAAAGDYALACMFSQFNRLYGYPAGWTKLLDCFNGTNLPVRVWAKPLDPDDIAAGHVTVTGTQDGPWLLEMIAAHAAGGTALRSIGGQSTGNFTFAVTGTTNSGEMAPPGPYPTPPQIGDTLIYLGAGYGSGNVGLSAGALLRSFVGTHLIGGEFQQLLANQAAAAASGDVSVDATVTANFGVGAAVVALYAPRRRVSVASSVLVTDRGAIFGTLVGVFPPPGVGGGA